MAELRPHLKREDFVSRVRRQNAESAYQLAYLKVENVKAVAGFRVSECFAWGKFLYVGDLVAGSDERSKEYGGVCLIGSWRMRVRLAVRSFTLTPACCGLMRTVSI
jgi:hypothetical protein